MELRRLSKMKVVVATPYFYPAIGGMEKHIYELSRRLIKNHGMEIAVITSNHNEKKYKEEVIEGIKIYRLPYWFKIFNTPINPLWYFGLKKILKKEKPDLINGRSPVPFMADLAVALSGNIPFVLGYHFPSMKDGSFLKDFLANLYEKLFLPFLLKKSKFIICSSDYVKNVFLRNYSFKAETVTQGVDLELFKPSNFRPKNTLMFCGNYTTEIKGLSYLIKALSNVREKFPDIKLKIIGKGNDGFYLKLIRKLKIENNVVFKGEIKGKDLVKEYQKSNIFVLPSLNDNLPSVLLEAMACKVPIIATNVGGISYLIKNNINGVLISPRNSKSIANSIEKLLKNRKLSKRLSDHGYEEIKNFYSWDKQAEKTKDIFEKVIIQK